jgi:tetratricopeptide (TPR) repeat protein
LKKVFETIVSANKTVFVLDNFNQIDGMSYEFLSYLVNSDLIQKQCKFILTYSEMRPVRGYLYSNLLAEDAYIDIALEKFSSEQIHSFVQQYMTNGCPAAILNQLTERCDGNPAKLEQYVSLAMDLEQKNNSFDMCLPLEFKDALKQRLDLLKYEDETAFEFLIAAAVQGIKFCPSIIGQVVRLPEDDILGVLVVLQQTNFILPVSEFTYSFRNSLMWSAILDIVKEDENYNEINERMYAIFSNYTLSSHSILAVISKNINQKISALSSWTDTIKYASFIGDNYLYIIAQKQCLDLIDALEEVNSSLIKNNIFERLGKLISMASPQEAMKYLPEAVLNAQKFDNKVKEIELLGYLAQCCMQTGDYYSTVDCIDTVIGDLDENYELEKALLKQRKLIPLLHSGNCGQIVNLADYEIMPVFEKYIGMKNLKTVSIKTLYIAWLKTYQTLAYTLAIQGSNRVFDIVSTMFELFEKNKFDEPLFICKTKLILALANTIKGDIDESTKILENTIKEYTADIMDSMAVSMWNTINIVNKILRHNFTDIQEELFRVVTFANNVNDEFTKNILKTLLGKIFKEQGDTKRALEIYNEEIIYFAKVKNATGAILTWYFIAEANLISSGPEEAIQVAQKALDVAQSTKINNYYFIVLLNKLLAEAYIVQAEYDLAKVHIEKAIIIARKFELLDLLAKLYLLYGKYLQEISLSQEESKSEYVTGASKMFNKAQTLAVSIKNDVLIEEIDTSESALKSFCKLNNIELK